MRIKVRALNALLCGTLLLAAGGSFAAESEAGAEGATQTNWKAWHAALTSRTGMRCSVARVISRTTASGATR